MKNYLIPTTSINTFSKKEFNSYSLSALDYKTLLIKNKNTTKLKNLITTHKVGKEIGSDSYMQKSKYRFLKTVNISSSFLLEESSIEYCKPENKIFPKPEDILIVKDGAGSGLGEIALYPYENNNNYDSLSAGIIAIQVEEGKKNYVFGLLKSQHFKDFIDLNTAQGSTIRHSKLIAFDYEVPFPTTKNHPQPKQVEQLVANIVQNIIHKEEQIKLKNKQIDELIEQELTTNQKSNTFSYSYPTINEIKQETRLDTGLYEKEFKRIDFLISNYINKYTEIRKYKIKTGRTPKDYFYTKYIPNKTYLWLTPKYIKKNTFISKQYLFTKKETNLIDGDLIFTGIGTNSQGHMLFYDKKSLGTVYINQNTYAISMKDTVQTNRIFTLCFLSSNLLKNTIQNFTSKGSVPAIYPRDIAKLKIPNFPQEKQQQIATLYYNPLDKNTNATLENYLEKEQIRNKNTGIFQLNMEIFTLKEHLEDLVDKIVLNKPITINNYF